MLMKKFKPLKLKKMHFLFPAALCGRQNKGFTENVFILDIH